MIYLRSILPGQCDGPATFAMHEALARTAKPGQVTLALSKFPYHTISLGIQESPSGLNLDFCNSAGICYVRRKSAGGAVLHSPHDHILCMAAPYEMFGDRLYDPMFAFHAALAIALKELGVKNVSYDKDTALLANGQKIAASARSLGIPNFYRHGYVIGYSDTDEKLLSQAFNGEINTDKTTSLRKHVSSADAVDMSEALRLGFQTVLRAAQESDAVLFQDELSPEERCLVASLSDEFYANSAWNNSGNKVRRNCFVRWGEKPQRALPHAYRSLLESHGVSILDN